MNSCARSKLFETWLSTLSSTINNQQAAGDWRQMPNLPAKFAIEPNKPLKAPKHH